MKRTLVTLLLVGTYVSAFGQRHWDVGVSASRERISYVNLSRVAALPARSQDLNMGMRTLYHWSKRLAFMGSMSYDMHRYLGRYAQSQNDFPSNVAMMQVQSVEVFLGVRIKLMSSARLYPYANLGVVQYLVTTREFPEAFVINSSPLRNLLPDLMPRNYNLALNATPGIRYNAHEYLSFDLEPVFKWFLVGNTSYGDQIALGWCATLNYKIGK